MNPCTEEARLLVASYSLARKGETIDLLILCADSGLDVYRALRAAWSLQSQGLLVARTLRPTLPGMVWAIRLTDPSSKLRGPVPSVSRSRRATDKAAPAAPLGTLLKFPRSRHGADAA